MTSTAVNYRPAEDYIPHRAPMLLLDTIEEIGDGYLIAATTFSADGLFSLEGKTPSFLGMELMAQAMGAYVGNFDLKHGNPIKIAFLLGSRKYNCNMPFFPNNKKLLIRVDENLMDESGIGIFDCSIHCEGELLASAQLKGIQPNNLQQLKEL